MESAIYSGSLRHRRVGPVRHEFTYALFMVFLDIDRLPDLMRISRWTSYNRFNWATFDERDHLGDPSAPLRARLSADAAAHGLAVPDGPIFLLTHLRYLGYAFNPISLFYCYDRRGTLETVLAEVHNTFGERHNYWLSATNRQDPFRPHRYRCAKAMHVSPFMPMHLDYRFVLPPPGERLVAHIRTLEGARPSLDATLALHREPWSAPALHRALRRFPWVTLKVIAAIHWEALRLYLKRVPVVPHPGRTETTDEHLSPDVH